MDALFVIRFRKRCETAMHERTNSTLTKQPVKHCVE